MSDNASELRSATFQATIAKLGARPSFIRAGRPQTNGCVERVQQTILDECWKPAFARYLIPKQTGLRLDLERYLRYDNTERAHTGRWTKGRTQMRSSGRPSCGTRTADASPQPGDRTTESPAGGPPQAGQRAPSMDHAATRRLAGIGESELLQGQTLKLCLIRTAATQASRRPDSCRRISSWPACSVH
jgi:hypothetical protein